MSTERQIQTPGEHAAPATTPTTAAASAPAGASRNKPGPKPRNAAAAPTAAAAAPAGAPAGDDLDEYDTDELPPRPEAAAVTFTPEQQAEIQRMIGAAVKASRASQDPATAARLAAEALESQKLPTQEAAAVMCDDMVRRGIRPRAVKTVDGWYTHPEMARTKDHGVAKLGNA